MAKKVTGKAWIEQIFNAKITQKRGVVRRNKTAIEKYASLDELKEEANKRNCHIVEVGEQWIVICEHGNVQIVV